MILDTYNHHMADLLSAQFEEQRKELSIAMDWPAGKSH